MATGTTAKQNFESGNVVTKIAGGAIEANRLVTLHSVEGQVVACSAITDVVRGVSLNKAASGEIVEIQTAGIAKVAVSAGVALGAQVMPTASGAGKCSTAAGATAKSCGIAETLTDTDGQLAQVWLLPSVNSPANS